MNIKLRRACSIILLASSTLLVSCSSGDEDLIRYIYRTKQKKARSIEPLPSFSKAEKFLYPEKVRRRNPFRFKSQKQEDNKQYAPNQNRPKMPLENFSLDALKFVGTIQDGSIKWGLVAQPNGKIVRIRAGDYMGENYGKILKITDKALLLQETVKVGGQWKQEKTTIALNKIKKK
jgi:type IV pilus assembly protein PilP